MNWPQHFGALTANPQKENKSLSSLMPHSVCHLRPSAQNSPVAIVSATLSFQNRAHFSKHNPEVDLEESE